MALDKVVLAEKLRLVQQPWSPKIVGEVNGQLVKLAKLHGEFVWHHHEDGDEMFLVIAGTLLMKFRDRDVPVNAGEFIVVPRGVEHLPVASEEVHVLLFEAASTVNTGNVRSERTVEVLERL